MYFCHKNFAASYTLRPLRDTKKLCVPIKLCAPTPPRPLRETNTQFCKPHISNRGGNNIILHLRPNSAPNSLASPYLIVVYL